MTDYQNESKDLKKIQVKNGEADGDKTPIRQSDLVIHDEKIEVNFSGEEKDEVVFEMYEEKAQERADTNINNLQTEDIAS